MKQKLKISGVIMKRDARRSASRQAWQASWTGCNTDRRQIHASRQNKVKLLPHYFCYNLSIGTSFRKADVCNALRGTVWRGVERVTLSQDRDRCWALVNRWWTFGFWRHSVSLLSVRNAIMLLCRWQHRSTPEYTNIPQAFFTSHCLQFLQ
jgi:hypothetical protein